MLPFVIIDFFDEEGKPDLYVNEELATKCEE